MRENKSALIYRKNEEKVETRVKRRGKNCATDFVFGGSLTCMAEAKRSSSSSSGVLMSTFSNKGGGSIDSAILWALVSINGTDSDREIATDTDSRFLIVVDVKLLGTLALFMCVNIGHLSPWLITLVHLPILTFQSDGSF